jgi:hypothetical protein
VASILKILDRQLISIWLSSGDLKRETDSEIIAAQDQALQTKYHATEKLQTETIAKQFDETVEHIILACPVLAKEQYIKRHDRVCGQLHFNKREEIRVRVKLDNKHWYGHVPKSVETSHEGTVTIFWNRQVRTDGTIPINKPDIIIHDQKKNAC